MNQGLLQDFWKIGLKNHSFQWEKVRQLNPTQNPGPRTRHTSIGFKGQFFVFGGQYKNQLSTNSLYSYNVQSCEWKNRATTGDGPLPIDSHCSLLDANAGKMYIVCGYMESVGAFSNAVYVCDLESDEGTCLSENKTGNNSMRGRVCASSALNGKQIFVFGGYDGQQRLNDLWKFSLTEKEWRPIKYQTKTIPSVKSDNRKHLSRANAGENTNSMRE